VVNRRPMDNNALDSHSSHSSGSKVQGRNNLYNNQLSDNNSQ
jgi:hypothetical protein